MKKCSQQPGIITLLTKWSLSLVVGASFAGAVVVLAQLDPVELLHPPHL
jgi:hypothetical protein